MDCPACGMGGFEIVQDDVDIGVGIQEHILGGVCKQCAQIEFCSSCGGWGGKHEQWHEDVICQQKAREDPPHAT